jgi:ATP-dependent Clp protease ATP-binding subunit ClpC
MDAMFERFTDRARKTMALANQEAGRLCHEYLGTEHVLLGLVAEGSGVAANALRNMGLDLRRIRQEVETLAKRGPEMVVIGMRPQTPRAKKVVEEAINAARELGHNYVGTEHLLLGLLREGQGIAAQVLAGMGVTVDRARDQVKALLSKGGSGEQEQADPSSLASVAKEPDVPASAPGASAVELLDLNRRVARLEAAAGRAMSTSAVLRLLVLWLAILTIALVAVLLALAKGRP